MAEVGEVLNLVAKSIVEEKVVVGGERMLTSVLEANDNRHKIERSQEAVHDSSNNISSKVKMTPKQKFYANRDKWLSKQYVRHGYKEETEVLSLDIA